MDELLRAWTASRGTQRLFERDASLWTSSGEERWLDWLDPSGAESTIVAAEAIADGARRDGLTHVLLAGMGGSSLAPEVLARVAGVRPGGLPLTVLDTVDPARLKPIVERGDLDRALVIVASKSGSTLEPNLLKDLLLERSPDRDALKRRFVAITDPGSSLDREAREQGWRAIVPGIPGIGGRYSALSPFGLVPAVLLGIDARELVARALAVRDACLRSDDALAVRMGVGIGAAAKSGRDKLTIVASERLAPMSAWIEQLVAESTGKQGKGILPVPAEPGLDPRHASPDRTWLALGDATAPGGFRIPFTDPLDLGAAFYSCEIATAIAGSILGINPFDQPDVEAAKVAARARLSKDAKGSGPRRVVLAERDGLSLETDERSAATLPREPRAIFAKAFGALRPPRWIGVLAWRCSQPDVARAVEDVRRSLGRKGEIATTLGVGPRFLHSTGQLHKGGPVTGAFLQVVGPDGDDLAAPKHATTFGSVLLAQAEGDMDVLTQRGRDVVLARLANADSAVRALRDAVASIEE